VAERERTVTGRPTWILDDADDRGIPTRAHCKRCGFGWIRPDNDPNADTLTSVARWHSCSDSGQQELPL
jgi:hypothetical protein